VKDRRTIGTLFVGAFHSDRIPQTTKDVTVHFLLHSGNSCKLHQRIPENVWSHYV